MDSTIIAAVLSGVLGAGFMGFLQFLVTRHDKKKEADSVERKALRYIMLYIIQERGKELLSDGKATLDEKRSLRQWHDVYHNGLHGNGDADKLMEAVDALPLDLEN